ncbi:hypothetical protein SUGI_1199410 [Cryptomeria japonica]|nr:hypothetical protein SUGI_1199410 [Cryptomeria japonica]
MEGGSDYVCRFCGGSFTKLQALGGHMKGHQSERAAERNQKAQTENSRNQIIERNKVGHVPSSISNLRSQLGQNIQIPSTTKERSHHFTGEYRPQSHPQRREQLLIPDKDLRPKGRQQVPDLNLPVIDHAQQIPDLNLPDTDDWRDDVIQLSNKYMRFESQR